MINAPEINPAISKLDEVRALLQVSAACAEGHADRLAVCRDLHRVTELCADMVSAAVESIETSLEGIL